MLKFSIIIAVYNIEQYIDQCLESLSHQSYSNIEILAINDGSTDGSLDRLIKWANKDDRIRIINKQNGGLSSARNTGLKFVTGDYVSYIDGDDWVSREMFATLNNVLCQKDYADIVTFSYFEIFPNNKKNKKSFSIDNNVLFTGSEFFEKASFKLTAWSKIYKTGFLKNSGLLFLENRLHEDIPYTVPLCLSAKSIINIDEPLYYYRLNRQGSIMDNISERNVNDFIYSVCYGYQWLNSNNKVTAYYKKWLVDMLYKSCLTTRTNFHTLKKCMISNKADNIINELTGFSKDRFLIKLFFTHNYLKIRVIGSNIKRFFNNL